MQRQAIRQALILVSLLLFPITIYYFSPVLVLIGAAEGIITGSLMLFGLQFLASLVLGRAFCGWLCPAAGLQEACFRMNTRRTGRRRWVKYLIWIPWVGGIAAALWSAGGPQSVQPLYQIPGGVDCRKAGFLPSCLLDGALHDHRDKSEERPRLALPTAGLRPPEVYAVRVLHQELPHEPGRPGHGAARQDG